MEDHDPQKWLQLAEAFRELGQYEDALAAVNQSLAVDSTDAEAWHKRGVYLLLLRRDSDAVLAFRRAVGVDNRHSRARFNLATLLREVASAEARTHLSVLWRHDPDLALLLEGQLDREERPR